MKTNALLCLITDLVSFLDVLISSSGFSLLLMLVLYVAIAELVLYPRGRYSFVTRTLTLSRGKSFFALLLLACLLSKACFCTTVRSETYIPSSPPSLSACQPAWTMTNSCLLAPCLHCMLPGCLLPPLLLPLPDGYLHGTAAFGLALMRVAV